jgi:hypothetical protein
MYMHTCQSNVILLETNFESKTSFFFGRTEYCMLAYPATHSLSTLHRFLSPSRHGGRTQHDRVSKNPTKKNNHTTIHKQSKVQAPGMTDLRRRWHDSSAYGLRVSLDQKNFRYLLCREFALGNQKIQHCFQLKYSYSYERALKAGSTHGQSGTRTCELATGYVRARGGVHARSSTHHVAAELFAEMSRTSATS